MCWASAPCCCAERQAAGLDGALDFNCADSRREPGGELHLPGASAMRRRLFADLAAMQAPLSLAGDGQAAELGARAQRLGAGHVSARRQQPVAQAQTTAPTPVSLSAHPYFNLAGPASGCALRHLVTLPAGHFLPTDERQIATGEIRAVAGTPWGRAWPRACSSPRAGACSRSIPASPGCSFP